MVSARQRKEEILVERHAERKSVKIVRGASFTHSQKLNTLEAACTVPDENGEYITIQGKDIYNKKTWDKYLDNVSFNIELGWLAGNAGLIANDYARWLRTGGHTKRYKNIRSRRARKWLRETTRLVVLHRILDYKEETHNFVDEWAESEMGKILLAKECRDDLHEAFHKAFKEDSHAEELLEKTYLKFLS